jgi:solute carrier family 31 (copper transporter), member 1
MSSPLLPTSSYGTQGYFALLLLPTMVVAQHLHGSTSDMEDAMMMGSTEDIMMVPYLHFTPGDAILFREWIPQKLGPFIGACIGLFLLGMLDRWLAAMRRLMETWWGQRWVLVSRFTSTLMLNSHSDQSRVDVILSKRFIPLNRSASSQEKGSPDDSVAIEVTHQSPAPQPRAPVLSLRNAAPFIPAHDFARGAMMIFQTGITYALMLTVMYASILPSSPLN